MLTGNCIYRQTLNFEATGGGPSRTLQARRHTMLTRMPAHYPPQIRSLYPAGTGVGTCTTLKQRSGACGVRDPAVGRRAGHRRAARDGRLRQRAGRGFTLLHVPVEPQPLFSTAGPTPPSVCLEKCVRWAEPDSGLVYAPDARPHLRVRHRAGPPRLQAPRQGGTSSPQYFCVPA